MGEKRWTEMTADEQVSPWSQVVDAVVDRGAVAEWVRAGAVQFAGSAGTEGDLARAAEYTTAGIMERIRPMPTREQIAAVIHGSDHDSAGTRCPGSESCQLWFDAERAEERVLALLNGAQP